MESRAALSELLPLAMVKLQEINSFCLLSLIVETKKSPLD
jgi:hypothetical protein